jgi:hypothetical protein
MSRPPENSSDLPIFTLIGSLVANFSPLLFKLFYYFIRGSDLVPSGSHYALENETIPKSISRVLNSASLREEYKKRKRDGTVDVNESQSVQRKKRKLSTKEEPLHILVSTLCSFFILLEY